MKGATWSGRELNWTRAPEQYGAIHFHDTDMSDCRWPVSLTLTVPADWKSGIYAARLRAGPGLHSPADLHLSGLWQLCPPRPHRGAARARNGVAGARAATGHGAGI